MQKLINTLLYIFELQMDYCQFVYDLLIYQFSFAVKSKIINFTDTVTCWFNANLIQKFSAY